MGAISIREMGSMKPFEIFKPKGTTDLDNAEIARLILESETQGGPILFVPAGCSPGPDSVGD